jgi:excinuclease UvrABC nuclease subunit
LLLKMADLASRALAFSMPDTLETLRERMQAAADALDFEEAKRLRDMIGFLSAGATFGDVQKARELESMSQRPGNMGLGTGQPSVEPPPG